MKAFGWEIPTWTCAILPQGGYLAKAELEQQLQQQQIIQSARQAAADLLWRARAKRQEFHQKAQADAQAWYEHQTQIWTRQNQEQCDRAIEEAIQWTIQEDQLENQVYRKMMETLRVWLQKTLNQWTQKLDWEALLSECIRAHLSEQSRTLRYTLWVAPESEPTIQAHFSHPNTLRIQIDPQCKPGQARLQTSQLNIAFDLKRQWENIVKCLLNKPLES